MGDESLNFAEVFPLEADVAETFKAQVPEKAKVAIKQSLKLLAEWKADLPADVLRAIGVLAAAVGYGETYGYPKKDGADDQKGEEQVSKEDTDRLDRLEKAVLSLAGRVREMQATKPEQKQEGAAEKSAGEESAQKDEQDDKGASAEKDTAKKEEGKVDDFDTLVNGLLEEDATVKKSAEKAEGMKRLCGEIAKAVKEVIETGGKKQ